MSNVLVSTAEDVATGGLLLLALANPVIAIGVAVLLLAGAVAALVMVRRVLRWAMRRGRTAAPPPTP